ncbi:hypothetical protein QAD02_011087 [Eretmocerus hayati]|uniref:Uncharacterized protein n=1 Tax=Eretmocerus hayati TaxID=131215 RepID=A0ACC2NWX6_9HYME|nr:hypothetical protein QAD02_011087 [Eretmocerus hayati]
MFRRPSLLPALALLLWISEVLSEDAPIQDPITNVGNHQFLVTIDIISETTLKPVTSTQTGAIISKDYVLGTSPTVNISNLRFIVRVGSNLFDKDGEEYEAELVILNTSTPEEPLNRGEELNQLKLVLYKVKKPIQFGEKANPVGLFDANDETIMNHEVILIGWGFNNNDTSSSILKRRILDFEVNLLKNDECNTLKRKDMSETGVENIPQIEKYLLPKSYSCASESDNNKNLSVIQPVDGAMLVSDEKLVGLFTGYMKADKIYYVYADVAHYSQSIRSVTGL